ncbi:MAG: H-type lectin domain-containing protein [Pseudomonadota bacterium]
MGNLLQSELAIDGGVAQVFDHIENEGPMWCGSGKRWARTVVEFDDPFSGPPKVQLSIAMIDADSGRNLRFELHAEDVTKAGFTAVAHTWSDTRIGRLQVNWTAIGSRTAVEGTWDV